MYAQTNLKYNINEEHMKLYAKNISISKYKSIIV